MVHGGILYLENGEFRLICEAVQERNRLLQLAPNYVEPLPTVIPIFNWHVGFWKSAKIFFGLATLSTGVMAGICFSSEHPRLSMSSTPIEGWRQVLQGGSIIKLGFCSMIYILSGFHSSGHIRWFWILVSSWKTPVWSNFQSWIPTSLLGQFIMMLWCFLLSV